MDDLNLDDILDAALDELEISKNIHKKNTTNVNSITSLDEAKQNEQNNYSQSELPSQMNSNDAENNNKPLESINEDTINSVLNQLQNDFSPSPENPEQLLEDVGNTMEELMKLLQQNNESLNMSTTQTNDGEQKGAEEAVAKLMQELQQSDDQNMENVVDQMMRQLVSKDLMYEPIKQVCDIFPGWLEQNKPTLSNEDFERYSMQYECFQKIIFVYEKEPENVASLMEIMQKIQEYGQPPTEIMRELAPELQFSPNGEPVLPNQMFSSLFSDKDNDFNPENCSVM